MFDSKKIITIIIVFMFYVFAYNIDLFGLRGTVVLKDDNGKGKEPVPILNPESLAKPIYEYSGVKRNVFAPVKRPKKIVKRTVRVPKKPVVVEPEPPKAVEVFTTTLSFMGFMEQESERTIYVADADDEVFIIKKGDTMEGRFDVEDLTETTLVLIDRETGEKASIELVVE